VVEAGEGKANGMGDGDGSKFCKSRWYTKHTRLCVIYSYMNFKAYIIWFMRQVWHIS
jgi:hypothetical protein